MTFPRLAMLFLSLCVAAPAFADDDPPPPPPELQPPAGKPAAMTFDEMVRPHDRYLFVGDEITQQMFYVRGVGAALIALHPEHDLRFFNGGKEDASAANANRFIDKLLELSKPTVVFISLGMHDLTGPGDLASRVDAYERDLAALVGRIGEAKSVRRVVVMTPPPIDRPDDTKTTASVENKGLAQLAAASERVAARTGAGFVNLFDHTRAVYVNAKLVGQPLTMNGRLPSEAGHVVLASLVLQHIGVTPRMLESVGWSPLQPRDMRVVRQSLAVPAKSAELDAAQRSRDLYMSFIHFDEAFFKAWRLAGRPTTGSPEEAMLKAEAAWDEVRQAAAPWRK